MSQRDSNTRTSASENAEKHLWIRVIEQAIDDAMLTKHQSKLWLRMDVLRARKWLTKPSKDFDMVCDFAGLEPCHVRAYAIGKIEKADADRLKAQKPEVGPGVVPNFRNGLGDRWTPTAQESEEIEFSQNSEATPCQ